MVNAGLILGSIFGTGILPTQPILAQVALGTNWSTFIGIALACSGVALYALRSMRPKLARDYDIFFAAVALLCGGILFFQGWRQDPILQFGQFLLTGSVIFFAFESIRMRGIATDQARKNTPIVDDERPVSPVYRAYQEAEFEELNPYEERQPRRRISGSSNLRSRDEYEDEERPRRPSTRRSSERSSSSDRTRRTRPRAEEGPSDYTDYTESRDDVSSVREDQPPTRTRGTSSRSGNQAPSGTRPRRPRPTPTEDTPPSRSRRDDSNSSPSEYVDYKPVDRDKGEDDNWGDY
ncbi:Ycf66 family protein [Leptolyngbya sp. FACHB-36]|uniref:Ycf66 family protein n=1 Tax=Leptolyngbya sp. FACHB-36 TaxID=2692808 RepID=UPI0016817015|nr:Ycf66 family protein [Leptolyngbya sp. FACHB-36]MBD2020595.1 Ycf66 family protein [Leptolyngbya sp. FACHB-36]